MQRTSSRGKQSAGPLFLSLLLWSLDKFPGNVSQCLQTSNHISLSDAIQKYFKLLDSGFPFYRQEMALVITQQVPVFTVQPGSFLPSARCKETHRSAFGYLCQQSTAPFKQACLTWFTVSLIQCLSIPWFQFFSFSKAASRIRMQLSNDAQNAQPQNCSSHLSNAPSQQWWEISQCYKVGGCPWAQRELDPWLLPAQLMLTHYIDKLNNLQKKHSVCFTSVHPLSVLTVLHDKKKGD